MFIYCLNEKHKYYQCYSIDEQKGIEIRRLINVC